MTLPAGLVRLGAPLPPPVAPEGTLLGRCVTGRVPVPAGAILLEGHDDLGPLRAGEHVLLRVLGTYPAVRVPTDRPAVLAAALRTIRLAAPAGLRHDVLVLRSDACVHAGRALTGGAADRFQAVEGQAHELDATTDVRVLDAPRLDRPWHRTHRGLDPWRTPLPPWAMRLSRLTRQVRRELGPAGLALIWADDGHRCRLLGVSPDPAVSLASATHPMTRTA